MTMKLIVACLMLVSMGWAQERAPMRADGLFGDWRPSDRLAEDPQGDASGAFDVSAVYGRSEGSRLFLRFDIGQVLNIQSGPKKDGTLEFRIRLSPKRELIVDLRGRKSYFLDKPGEVFSWSKLHFLTAPTFAAREFEMQIDLAFFGTKVGDRIELQLSGSDSLAKPVHLTMTAAPGARPHRNTKREPGTDFRIVSLNTLRGGLLDEDRSASIRRLVHSVKPDILCFQEEYDIRKEAQVLSKVLGTNWNTCRNRDCIIASPHQVKNIAARLGRCSVGLVMLPSSPILVINTHPHAAGYIGNKNDRKRVTEMTRIAAFLAEFRSGAFAKGFAKYRDAPVICIGDWNLVGSRTPLDVLVDDKGPALKDWFLSQLVGESTATWRELEDPARSKGGGFAPGRLDLLTYCPKRLRTRNGFILDSEHLPAAILKKLGLEKLDSRCSDHLLMVGDFSLRKF